MFSNRSCYANHRNWISVDYFKQCIDNDMYARIAEAKNWTFLTNYVHELRFVNSLQ